MMDIGVLRFPEDAFDAALCGHGLQFAPHLDRALDEARRVVHGGARFAASVPVTPLMRSVFDLLDSVIDRLLPPGPKAVDQQATRAVLGDSAALAEARPTAGVVPPRAVVAY